MLTLCLAALVVAGTPVAPTKKDATMKTLLKDVNTSTSEDGGSSIVNGLDVSRMPFTPDSIKQVVLSYQPQIQSCYEETLAVKDQAVEGNLKTSFLITGDGYVSKAKVDKKLSSLRDPKLHECVVSVLSSMQFPKPPDGKEHPIEFPFNLKAIH